MLRKHFGEQKAFEPENLQRLYTRVKPDFIRVDADKSPTLLIILRYEIERALIEGEIEVEDIPALWNSKMQQWLGLSTAGIIAMAAWDIHWTGARLDIFRVIRWNHVCRTIPVRTGTAIR